MVRPYKILHVVHSMNCGGVETWLMNILRNIDRDRYHMDFLIRTQGPGDYDNEIVSLGSRVIPCLNHHRPWIFASNFFNILDKFGPYDIVHSHGSYFNGLILRLAAMGKVPVRIAHSHTNEPPPQSIIRRLYNHLITKWIQQYATLGFAVSDQAAASLFGPDWKKDERWRILYCGIDLRSYEESEVSLQRTHLNIPDNAIVIGHVGRFYPPKNHFYLLSIAREIIHREPRAIFLLVGDGPLKPLVESSAQELGLRENIIFTGTRFDIPQLMKIMDVFLFPSLYEGLPLVLIEAQASGLPCIISDIIPREATIVPKLVQRLNLGDKIEHWADTVISTAHNAPPVARETALEIVKGSYFNIHNCINMLLNVYNTNLFN